MRFRLAWISEAGFGIFFLAILFFFCRHLMFADPGTQWHTVTGEKILQEGFISSDSYSYTFHGKEWIPSQWLAEVGMAKLFAYASWDGLMWGTILFLAILLGWISARAVEQGCHPILAGLLGCIFFACMAYHIHCRPHSLTMLLLAVFFALLIDIEAKRISLYQLFWVFPLSIFWVNVHGGVLAGWGTLGITIIGWMLMHLFRRSTPLQTPKQWIFVVVLGLACGVTVLINPYGWTLVRMWQVIMKADLPNLISEHRPLDFTDVTGMAVLANFVLYMFIWVGTWKSPQRVVWWIPLLWFYLACTRIRHGPLFGLVAGLAIIDMLPYCRWMIAFARKSDLFVPPSGIRSIPVLHWMARCLPLLVLLIPWVGYKNLVQLNPEQTPLELMEEIEQELRKPGVVIFNDDRFGGFLIRHFPQNKVFMDDRCELYGEKFISEFAEAKRDNSPDLAVANRWIDTWIERYGINVALVPSEKDSIRDAFAKRKDWKLIKETKPASLFVRLMQ